MSPAFRDALIHLSWPNATFYWVTLAAWFINGFCSLVYLKRLKEKHHLYWGAILGVLPWWPIRILGYLLVVDDSIQHSVQVYDVQNGKPPRPDWTPVHKLGVALLKWFGYSGS